MLQPSRDLTEPAAIRIVLQRLCREAGFVNLKLEGRAWPFPLLAESETQFALGMTVPQRTRWKLEPGSNYELTLMDRGRRYQATVKLRAWDDLDGQECGQFSHPRSLEAVDYTGLSDYVPDQPMICTFTSPGMDICEGRLRSLGNEGLEFALWGAGAIKEGQLKVGAPTTVELPLEKGVKAALAAVTASIDERTAAVRFNAKADPNMLGAYRGWLRDTILTQQRKDFERFDVHGFLANRRSASARVPGQAEVRLLSDKDPLVLVIGEGGFTQRIRETLGRKFGIAELDYIKGDVRPLLGALGGDAPDWGRTRLLLINQRLRLSSGLELTRQLTQGEACPLPILMAGTEEDAALKRNRAIAAGAVDFIAVEPFKILAVMRAMEETLSLFR